MSDITLKLTGDKELLQVLRNLDNKTQHKFLKRVVGDAAQKTVVKNLKRESPVKRGNLRRAMGKVMGKSKRVATVFAGPRRSHRNDKADHSGWVANILEHAKDGRRFPKNGQAMKIGNNFVKSVGPIRKKTNFRGVIINSMREAEDHMAKSVRTIIERAVRKR